MMVLAHEAVKDPTAVVKRVREEVEKRKANHEARNQERKLTPEERKRKKIAKYIEDANLGLYAVLFVIHHLEGSNTYAKIWRNAIGYQLSGCCVTTPKHAVIVVEGGQKAIKKYKKLLLKRIKWEEIGENNFCKLVWEGPVFFVFDYFYFRSLKTCLKALNVLNLRRNLLHIITLLKIMLNIIGKCLSIFFLL